MDHDLHDKEGKEESDPVEDCSRPRDATGGIALLRDVIIERQDGASQVEGRIQRICKIISKGVVLRFGREINTVAFREVRGIELLLLMIISRESYNSFDSGEACLTSIGLLLPDRLPAQMQSKLKLMSRKIVTLKRISHLGISPP